jgi:inner membrane protein
MASASAFRGEASLALPAAAASGLSRGRFARGGAGLDTYIMLGLGLPRQDAVRARSFFIRLFSGGVERAGCRVRRKGIRLGLLWALCAVTHPLLDMLTDGGPGVMLLYPFETARLFFPWRPIHVSPLGIGQFFKRAGEILRSETPFCAGAAAVGLVGFWMRRRL